MKVALICAAVMSWETLLPEEPGAERDPVSSVHPAVGRGAPTATGTLRGAATSEAVPGAEIVLKREVVMDGESAPLM